MNFNILKENNTEWVINELLNGIELTEEQLDSVIKCMSSPTGKIILADEMGLGKTYICMGLIQLAKIQYPNKKILISTPKSVLKNFEKLIKESTDSKVITSTGGLADINFLENNYKNYDVILVQHSFWINAEQSLLFIYNHMDDFSFTFFDEADFKNADGFDMFLEFMKNIPLGCISNATPIEDNTKLIYNLLYGCGAVNTEYNKFKNKYSRDVYRNDILVGSKVYVDKLYKDFSDYITVKNRSDIGLTTNIDINFRKIYPSKEQLSWMECGMTKNLALYSPETYKRPEDMLYPVDANISNIPALKEVIKIIQSNNRKKIIYVKNTKAIIQISKILNIIDKNPYIIDGKSTKTDEQVKYVENRFNEDDNGIMITNIIKGINLNTAEELIIYNNPSDLQQLIYRMIRGFASKDVKVHWIYYKGYEEDSINKILSKTKNVSNLLGRELDIITQLEKEIGVYQNPNIPKWQNKWLNERKINNEL